MNKQIIFLFLTVIVFSCFSIPQVYAQNSLKVNKSDGSSVNIPLKDIRKITFKDINTSVPDYAAIQSLIKMKIYPNPMTEFVNIEYSLNSKGSVKIEIFDISGKSLFSEVIGNKLEGNYIYKLDTNELLAGIYLCKISQNKEIETQKIVVNK